MRPGIPPEARRYGPGIYASADGVMHIELDEYILAAGGNPADPTDRATALRVLHRVAREQGISLEAREH